jgi:hypothetical protein
MKNLLIFERFYKPPIDIKIRLSEIVKELESKFGGGKEFFEELDNRIKDIENEDMILNLVRGNSNEWLISSGGFGDRLWKLWKSGKIKCKGLVIFNGKMLTLDKGVENWYPPDFDLNDKKFIYIDDSYFSGSTVRKIDSFLKKYNSSIKSVSVIYDGSKKNTNFVKSFFRYYN